MDIKKTISFAPQVLIEEEEEDIEPWEKGLRPVERFEKLIEYAQINKLLKNSFFKSLDKVGQVDALTRALDNMIHKLDLMAQSLMKVSTTHPEGVKINRVAVTLSRLKLKLVDDFARGIDIVTQINQTSQGKRYF